MGVGEFNNEPAEIWVFKEGQYTSVMTAGGSRYHHYETYNAIRIENTKLRLRITTLELQCNHWADECNELRRINNGESLTS